MSEGVGIPLRTMKGQRKKLLLVWTFAAALLVVLGSVGSFVGANSVANSADQKNQKAFLASSNEIAATLKLAIQREQDLISSTESFLIGNPHATQAEFNKWSKNVEVLRRYKDLSDLGIIQYVTSAQLSAYVEHASSTQSTPFVIDPAGNRPFYCLAAIGIFRPGTEKLPKDVDLCAGPLKSLVTDVRSSGKSEVLPFTYLGLKTIALETPIYRNGYVPSTVAARDKTFVEIIALSVVPKVILQTALEGHPNTTVVLRYGGHKSALVFRSGVAPVNAQSAKVNLHDGWVIETYGTGSAVGLFGSGDALAIFFGGIALSWLLGVLIFLLGTGRARSMLLVNERTEQLQFQALHDSLTGLPNRALIVDRIDQLLERNHRNGTQGAALYIDLDDFKNVNDTLGHGAGDHLLVSVAQRMKSTLRGADTIGRMGGDEFVVLIDGGDHMIAPDLVAQRLLDVMHQPFQLEGAPMPLMVNASIGIAMSDRKTGSEFLRDADVALYQAKAAGKNQYVFFNQQMQTDIGRRISLEFDLRSALSENQFHLAYQPIYNLEDLTIVGVEALLRWQHPTEGVIQPDEFIPILERTGHIREVGAWVLREACSQMALWHSRGDTLDVSVNVSGRQLDSDHFVDQIRDALIVSGLAVTSLIIEITETALMLDINMVVKRLQAVRDLGVRIAIDDFGTGYSSLSHLRQFPVDCIKIDKSFTNALATSDESRALVKTFIQLGRDLGLKTLAEGVESVEQIDLLRESNVTEVQGFLLSRPLDPEILETQLLEPMRPAGSSAPPVVT